MSAASLELHESTPNELTADIEFHTNVHVQIDSVDGTQYYLRGVFYKKDSKNYCGLTWNGSEWFAGPYTSDSGWKKFLKITIASSSSDIAIKAKIDPTDSGCKDSGEYGFKVQRFTESGSGSFDKQNDITVHVNAPKPSDTSAPKPSATSKPSPTKTLELTAEPTKIIGTVIPTLNERIETNDEDVGSATVAAKTISVETLTPVQARVLGVSEEKHSRLSIVTILLGSGGLLLLLSAGVSVYQMKKKV